MSVQIPLFEKTPSRPSNVAGRAEEIVGGGFDAKTFIENFAVLVDASAGVEKLRGLVLHLAVRGRLLQETPQVREQTPKTEGLSVPFGLPKGWAWRRVDEVGELKLGRQRSPKNHTGPNMRPYLRVANVHEARIDTSDLLEMNFDPAEAERFLLRPNDVLLNEGQSYELVGRPAIYRGEVDGACFQNTLIRFRPNTEVVPEFALAVFRAYMRTGRFRREAQQTTNIAHLSLGRLAEIEFPLPPLAEQKRIVAKVDQLMALCDDLEVRQTKKRVVGTRLTKSAFEAVSTAEGPEEFGVAWKRVFENFGLLADRAEKLDTTRTMVLTLAVRGRLTATSPRQTVEDDSARPPLPTGWSWKRVDEVAEVKLGKMRSPDSHSGAHMRPYLRVANVLEGKIDTSDVKAMNFTPDEVTKFELRSGDILLNEGQSIDLVGRPAIYRGEVPGACFQKTLIRVRVRDFVDVEYALIVFRAYMRTGRFRASGVQTTNMAHLPLMRLVGIEFPVPPLEEQRRIVAKVGRMMKICDELEAKLRRAEDRAGKLVEAAVQELVEGESTP